MMLIVTVSVNSKAIGVLEILNVSKGPLKPESVNDYAYTLHDIEGDCPPVHGEIKSHTRSLGWKVLVGRVLDDLPGLSDD